MPAALRLDRYGLPIPTPADIRRMSPAELQAVTEILEDRYDREGLADFIRRVFPGKPPPPHMAPLIERFEAAKRGQLQRVCLSMPPRHAKSVIALEANAWWLHRAPADTNAYFSYNEAQGQSMSRKARAYAQAAGIQLRGDSSSVSEWRTIPGGGLLAGGIGGALTGRGVTGCVIIDDPHKDRADADSAVRREHVWEWFNEVVYTRLETASAFVIHTRWHSDDLIGRLTAQGGWDIINVPAIAEEGDLLGRAPGAALWPERFDLESLQAIRSQIGEFSFAALYQGRPRPRGASVFGDPTYFDPSTFSLTGKQIILAADPAASESTSADYSAIVAMAVEGHAEKRRAWILDVYRRQVGIPQFCRDAVMFQRKHGNAKLLVEAVGGFKAVPQVLKDTNPALLVQPITPKGDKFQRAQAVASAWNEGRVMIPTSAPWLEDFLAEVTVFTGVNDAHEDMTDCVAYCWNHQSRRVDIDWL